MSATVVLIRHGQTYWNKKKRFQGQVNIPLNDTGRAQARALHEEIKDFKFDVCYSSPLDRAVETAKLALADDSVPIIKQEGLIEQSYGLGEGSSYRKTPWYYLLHAPHLYYDSDPARYTPSIGAESFDDLYARVQNFLDEVLVPACEKHNTILLSGHGGVDAALEGTIRNIPFSDFWSVKLPNCGHSVFTYENGVFTFDEVRSSEKNPRG